MTPVPSTPAGYRLVPAGDAALVVAFEPPAIDPGVNARAIALADAMSAQAWPGVLDIVPAYCSVTVHYPPLTTDVERLARELDALAASTSARVDETRPVREVPVCYGAADGPDLDVVAAFAGCTADEVVRRHTGCVYRVYMLGFLPGFAYMGSVDPVIAAPRRETPRTTVPAGSVGIAGAQTGVYPAASPGGWQLIGRTPVRPFDLGRAEPFLFAAGDRVRFVAIDRAAFARLDEWA